MKPILIYLILSTFVYGANAFPPPTGGINCDDGSCVIFFWITIIGMGITFLVGTVICCTDICVPCFKDILKSCCKCCYINKDEKYWIQLNQV